MPMPESVPVGAGGERLPSEEKREAPSLKGLEEDFEERREVYRSPSPGDDFINMSDRESPRETERRRDSVISNGNQINKFKTELTEIKNEP